MSRTPLYDRVTLVHPSGYRVRTTTRYRFALVTLHSSAAGGWEPRITRSSSTLQTLTDLLPRFAQHRHPVIFDTHTQQRVA